MSHDKMKDNVIRILSHDINIEFSNPDLWSDGGLGRACLKASKISLNDNLSTDLTLSTLLHECIHIISNMMDLELSESQVSGVGNGIFTIIKDNHEYIKELVSLIETTINNR